MKRKNSSIVSVSVNRFLRLKPCVEDLPDVEKNPELFLSLPIGSRVQFKGHVFLLEETPVLRTIYKDAQECIVFTAEDSKTDEYNQLSREHMDGNKRGMYKTRSLAEGYPRYGQYIKHIRNGHAAVSTREEFFNNASTLVIG